MTAVGPQDRLARAGTDGRRVGYVVAAAVNAVALYVVTHLLAWGVPAFLTDDFDRVLPVIRVSLIATIIANVVYVVHDAPAFRALTQAGLSGIALVATVRLLDVFPFAFAGSEVDWALVVRVVLLVALVGTVISIVVELARFVRATAHATAGTP